MHVPELELLFEVPHTPKYHYDVCASFAAAFCLWRLKNNMPLKKIAVELGLSIATVSAWELGKRFPSSRSFKMLVDYMEVPPCRLFCVAADKCVPHECVLALPKKP